MLRGAVDSPFGPISFIVEDSRLTRIQFADGPSEGAGVELAETARQLTEYFLGERHAFDLPLAPAVSPFQAQLRDSMIAIPYGGMRTYGEIAKELGSASQAVGQACGANPIPIVVPCHRVVAAGGRLGGFSGGDGAPTKKRLLNHEAVHAP